MSIATVASETKATAILAECRRCLSIGAPLEARYIKDVIDQLENATVTDTSGRTNVTPNHALDGRNTVEGAAVDA